MKIKRSVSAISLVLATAVAGALFAQAPAHADHTVPLEVPAAKWEKTSFQCGTAQDGRKMKIWKIEAYLSTAIQSGQADYPAIVKATFNAAYGEAALESRKSKVNFPKRDEVVPSSGVTPTFPTLNYWTVLSICV